MGMKPEAARQRWYRLLGGALARYTTIPALAAELGLHDNTVQNWITRGSLPELISEPKVAEVLGLPVDELHGILDCLRLDQAERREATLKLVGEVGRPRRPFRGGAAAQAAPTGRGSRVRYPLPAQGQRPITGARKSAKTKAKRSSVKWPQPRVITGRFAPLPAWLPLLSPRRRAA